MNQNKLIKSDIEFNVDGKQVSFSIIHNLPEINGLSINDALENWLPRTRSFKAKDFVNYIKSKNTGHVAMTEKQYKRGIAGF